MISIEDALRHITDVARRLPPTRTPLNDAAGLVLAEDAAATADSPPFTKAMMDGFAVRTADLSNPTVALPVRGEVAAAPGTPPSIEPQTAVRIMTGGPVPGGADAVIPVEVATEADGNVRFEMTPRVGQNVLRRGSIGRAGEPVLPAGSLITPRAAAALGEYGFAEVAAVPRPTVAFASTGDELVDVSQTPGPGQIRNSSTPMLRHLIESWHCDPVPLGVALDTTESLDDIIRRGLEADVLLLTGGVSAGNYDLVPDRLAAAGVRPVFHKVAIKPGKPIWFGVVKTGERRTLVFGLPGNPVSSLVCAEVFVRSAVDVLAGRPPHDPQVDVALAAPIPQKGDRTTYWPATLSADGQAATPADWRGSADLLHLATADGWLVLPPGSATFAAGHRLPFHRPAL